MGNIKRIIKDVLSEGIKKVDGQYEFNPNGDNFDDIIKFNDGISSITNNIYGDNVLVGIAFNSEGDHKNKLQFIKDLKFGDNITEEQVNYILDTVVKNLDEQIGLSKFDFIVSPQSSSKLNSKLMYRVGEQTNGEVISNFFVKNEVENIWMDIEKAKLDGKNNKFLKRLPKRFEMAKSVDNQSIKLQPLNRYERMYLRDFLRVNDEHKVISSMMGGAKVLLVDDIFSSGKTTNDMSGLLKSIGVDDVTIFTLFSN